MNESRGSKSGTAWEPLAISRPSLRGPEPRDVDALACEKRALTFPNPNPQNATAVQPSAFGGFATHAPGTTSQSIFLSLHLQRETCRNGCGKTTSMIPLIICVFGEFGSPDQSTWEFQHPHPLNCQKWGRTQENVTYIFCQCKLSLSRFAMCWEYRRIKHLGHARLHFL